MPELTTIPVIIRELDVAISLAGVTVYFNALYGTCRPIDPVYILRMQKARNMLTSPAVSQQSVNYAKDLLTIKRNG